MDSKFKMTVEVDIVVDEEWINFVTMYNDIFRTDHCGYWLSGMDQEDDLGWLVYESGEDDENAQIAAQKPEYKKIVKDWKNGKLLPKKWFRLNRDAAIKAWIEGVKKYGVDWYENSDAITYDNVIQLALLNEIKYA